MAVFVPMSFLNDVISTQSPIATGDAPDDQGILQGSVYRKCIQAVALIGVTVLKLDLWYAFLCALHLVSLIRFFEP